MKGHGEGGGLTLGDGGVDAGEGDVQQFGRSLVDDRDLMEAGEGVAKLGWGLPY